MVGNGRNGGGVETGKEKEQYVGTVEQLAQ